MSSITAVEEKEMPLVRLSLGQNYPNPFNAQTTIPYSLDRDALVKLSIYDIGGQKVATLIDAYQKTGAYQARWSGRNYEGQRVGSGIFFYKLKIDREVRVKRLILLK